MPTSSALILQSFLHNTLPTRLVLLQDCPAQSAQPILSQLITRHNKNQNAATLLVSSLHHLSRFQDAQLPSSHRFNVAQLGADEEFQRSAEYQRIVRVVSLNTSRPLSIVVNSVQELVRLLSAHIAFQLLRSLLDLLPNPESRLVVVDSPHLQTSSSQRTSIHDSSALLRSSSLSTSYLHLRIHPTSLLDHVINVFGLPVPAASRQQQQQQQQQAGTQYDVRLFGLLDELAGGCDPYVDPLGSEKTPVAVVPQALMVRADPCASSATANLGTCVVEWTARNLPLTAAVPSASIALKPPPSQKKNRAPARGSSSHLAAVQHGLEALRLVPSPPHGFQLEPLPVSKVLVKRAFKLKGRAADQAKPTPVRDPELTFNLSLTDKQRAEREAVALPFLPRRAQDGTVIEAPGLIYDGSFQDPSLAHNKPGMIHYDPDSADDFDDEEPDDEL
ncbi:hypothetical protein PCASD_16645 [Puccinia coronata f. sp. avenae]|uniref:Elongator complex protein 5 n=1 Tax=Puccinia coronata f. sp. avenae TaxID=200324 RepID=A0A2N5SB99_9BASI|nr:hypothetical protein PCASD_16645 [Puccinia coronata f. sp. avenae]